MSGEVIAALLGGAFLVLAASISVVGVVVGKLVLSVREQVTPNGGKSAHDKLVRRIDSVRSDLHRAIDDLRDSHSNDLAQHRHDFHE